MGVCFSCSGAKAQDETDKPQTVKNRCDSNRQRKDEFKVLLLGSGESGKSTIVKQMKIIHQDGYSEQELFMFRITILKNLLDSIKAIALALRRFDMEPHLLENREAADLLIVFELPADANATLPAPVAQAISGLWSDPVIAQLLQRRARITDPDYLPSQEDVLHSRSKTTGIVETKFQMGNMRINLVDVGGQRSERNMWIHSFESVTSIIFCVALSEYDQMLLEDKSQNRMAESLVLFESIVNSRWFLRTSVILFLNKIDIFTKKLPLRPLANYFPDYKGGDDVNKAAKYILWRFTSLNHAKLQIYPHITQATDTNNIRLVFAAVKEYVYTLTQNPPA
ncbi:Guanine nucleotide-binding protein alpha-2 subunit [Malassezia nana]|uniref:Guanine nucleotide-binding protein alpha-2 subunit n=1 Tax=Malassezia nana TaxID=180528 RepID=A0AAF0ELF9_9BASI|nr:Guanine nucleotide-binding protein alpha-2 subunit [Malassezia nana]